MPMDDIFFYRLGQKRSGGSGGGGGSTDEGWIGDGNTHIWISLAEGRTSPMLGVCPNGTVTVDWGDGSEPDVLTGTNTSTVQWTPNHEYAEAGDYVISLTVVGEMWFYDSGSRGSAILRYSSSADNRNYGYRAAVQRVEIGESVTSIGSGALRSCNSLASVVIPESVMSIGDYAFSGCYSLASVVIPKGVTSIGDNAFSSCNSLASVVIPESVMSIGDNAFSSCNSLASVVIPKGVTSIGGAAFSSCYSVRYYDFTACVSVPTLAATNVFQLIPADCEIRVPAALTGEWKAATNWSTYADYIVGV